MLNISENMSLLNALNKLQLNQYDFNSNGNNNNFNNNDYINNPSFLLHEEGDIEGDESSFMEEEVKVEIVHPTKEVNNSRTNISMNHDRTIKEVSLLDI